MSALMNIFTNLPASLPTELIEPHLTTPGMRIERIVSHCHAPPDGHWYDRAQKEWAVRLTGAARLRFEGEEPVEMAAGNYVNIPAHRRHRVEWTDATVLTIWLAIHYS